MTLNSSILKQTPIERWHELSKKDKPLMVIFSSNPAIDKVRGELRKIPGCALVGGHPLSGNEHCIYDGKVISLKEHPEMWDVFGNLHPSSYQQDKTTFFLYHKYFGQFDSEDIDYCLKLTERYNLPCIYLMNDYEYERLGDPQKRWFSVNFEVIFFDIEI